MNELVSKKLWEALQEAAKTQNLAAVQEILSLLSEDSPAEEQFEEVEPAVEATTSTAGGEKPEEENLQIIKATLIEKDQISVLPNYRQETLEAIRLLEEDVLPCFAAVQRGIPFTRGILKRYIDDQGIARDYTLSNALGSLMRSYFVHKGVVEIVSHKCVRFTASYIHSLQKDGQVLLLQITEKQYELFEYFETTLIPRLARVYQYRQLYSFDDVHRAFLKSRVYNEQEVDYPLLRHYLISQSKAESSDRAQLVLTEDYLSWIKRTKEGTISADEISRLLASSYQ